MAQGQPLTNQQLQQLTQDPDFKPEDLQLLSAEEKVRLKRITDASSTTGRIKDTITGVGKGAAETAFDLGNLVHQTPIIGNITDKLSQLIGPKGTDPNAAFRQVPPELKAENTAQTVGKTGEQIGEFLIPAGPSRLEAVKGLVRLIPNGASPRAMMLANKMLAYTGRVIGEAGSATAVSALHGDEHPETSGKIAGGTTITAEMLGPMAKALMKTKLGSEIAPLLAAIAAMKGLGGMSPEGLGAGLGTYGVLKHAAQNVLRNPKVQARMGSGITKAITKGGELAAGVESESRVPKRRRLREAMQP